LHFTCIALAFKTDVLLCNPFLIGRPLFLNSFSYPDQIFPFLS
jgi:hypothetical protein